MDVVVFFVIVIRLLRVFSSHQVSANEEQGPVGDVPSLPTPVAPPVNEPTPVAPAVNEHTPVAPAVNEPPAAVAPVDEPPAAVPPVNGPTPLLEAKAKSLARPIEVKEDF